MDEDVGMGRQCDGEMGETSTSVKDPGLNKLVRFTSRYVGEGRLTDNGDTIWKIQGRLQASAKEDEIYEKMTLNIDLDMKKTTEGMVWTSCWNFSQRNSKEDQDWIQKVLENIEHLGRKMMYKGGT
jgi:hypothetical protein